MEFELHQYEMIKMFSYSHPIDRNELQDDAITAKCH